MNVHFATGRVSARILSLLLLLLGCFLPSNSRAAGLQYYTNPSIGVNANAAWGQFVTLNYSVINTGTVTSGAFSVEFFLSSTATFNASTSYLWYTETVSGGLPPNYYVAGPLLINLPQTIPSGLSTGTVYVGMAIVQNGTVIEINKGIGKDITSLTTTAPLTLPDIIGFNGAAFGDSYSFGVQQTTATWGQNLGVSQALLNQSVVSSGSFTCNIYLSETNHFVANSSSCYVIGSFNVSSLTGGSVAYSNGYVNYLLPMTNPFGDSATTFYVGMIINPSQSLAEASYSNDSNQGAGIDMGSQAITITKAVPQMSVAGSTPPGNNLSFGNIAVDGPGGATGTQTLSITNNGAAPLTISNISVTGPGFAITSVASTLTTLPNPMVYPSSIQGNGAETWVVAVTFDPTVVSTNITGTLTVASNDPTTPNLHLTLSGNGTAVSHLVFADPVPPTNDLNANFGNVPNGTTSSLTFTLTNTGSGFLQVAPKGIFLTNTQGGVWSIASITSSTQGPINLNTQSANIGYNGNETWSVIVNFTPSANASYETALEVQSSDPTQGSLNCTLTGTGVTPMALGVANSLGSSSTLNFGSAHATGSQQVTATLTLTNPGGQPLVVSQNGISLANTTNFQIVSIQSNLQGSINLATGTATIAPNGTESWTVTVVFDPVTNGSLSTQLTIQSNAPGNATDTLTLNGTGLNQPGIVVTNRSAKPSGTAIPFGPVLNDGPGGRVATQSLSLQNVGLQPVIIPANGIVLANAQGFSIQSITSSSQPSVNLASVISGGGTIAPKQAETWTVTLAFDPTANTSYTGTLNISSNDPVNPTTSESLTGAGTTPTITLLPQTANLPTLYVPAGQICNISWNATYTAGTATITLNTDSDTNPASGLVPIASIPYSPTSTNPGSYAWRPSASLVGQEFYLYGTISDGSVSNGSYSTQKVHVEAANAFNMLSGLITTNTSYNYQYIYNGTVYSGSALLQPGANTVTITTPVSGGGSVAHQVIITQVASLSASQGYTYDEVSRIKTYTNGNGITTSYRYDLAGNCVQTSASNGNQVTYTYDNAKNKLSMTDGTGTTFYDYDDLNHLEDAIYSASGNKADPNNLAIQYQYDNANRISDTTYPGGEHIQYTWDNGNRLKQVDDLTTGQITGYTYNYTTGLLSSVSHPNGVVTSYGYNGSGFLNDIKHKLGSSLLAEYNYTLDSNGNATALLTTFQDGSQKQNVYSYDGVGHLVQVIYGSSATASANDQTITYTYDGAGNRLTQQTKLSGSVTQTLTYHYGVESRLSNITDQNGNTTASYFYDAAGNRIQKITSNGSTYYTYNENNVVTSILTPTDYETYTYNGAGARVGRAVDGTATSYVVDPSQKMFNAIQERNASGIVQSFVYGMDRLLANPASGTPAIYLRDRIGSVRLITNGSGGITSSDNFDAFGNPSTQ